MVKTKDRFANLNGISDLAHLIVETVTHSSCPLVYREVKLALVLLIATATIERLFSKLKLTKTDLRNRMGPEYNALCGRIGFFYKVKDDDVMERFQAMKKRRGQIY